MKASLNAKRRARKEGLKPGSGPVARARAIPGARRSGRVGLCQVGVSDQDVSSDRSVAS